MPVRVLAVVLVALSAGCARDAAAPADSSEPGAAPVTEPAASEPTAAPETTAGPDPSATTATSAPVASDPLQDPTPDAVPAPSDPDAAATRGAALVAAGGAEFAPSAGGPRVRIMEGVTLVVEGRDSDLLAVETPCETRGTVDVGEVAFVPAAEPDGAWETALFVIDAGHGGPTNTGAQGPSGLWERDANIDIARRVGRMLADGAVVADLSVPPAAGPVLSRRSGPPDANYEVGSGFRARLANALAAAAIVSVHNNAGTDVVIDFPGSEAFYPHADTESRRLAGLMVEEFRLAFAPYDVAWVGASEAGARYRLNDNGADYYSLLRNARVPAIIAEGAYVSNPEEEALLRTPEFRQAYADAVVRALYRFVTTDDPGSHFNGAFQPNADVPPGGAQPDCALPVQP